LVNWFDVGPFLGALVLLVARHLWVMMRSSESKDTLALRAEWVRRILRHPGSEVLAVQTLRNSIMAATVMASTSAIALMGVVSLGHFRGMSPELQTPLPGLFDGGHLKLALPLVLLAASLVLFSKASRLYHRCGYLVGLSQGTSELYPVAEASAISELERASLLYRNGWRSFYAAIATGAWLVSGWLSLIVTLALVVIDVLAKAE
jgi:uncharacterized membrane protein